MRISPFPLLLTVLLAAPLTQASTVQSGTRKPQVLSLGNKASVSLALPILDTGLPDSGYIVKRSGPGGDKTFTLKPLNKVEAVGKYQVSSDDYDLAVGALAALKTTTGEERGFLMLNLLNVVTNLKLAHALNLVFEDTGLAAGTYTYSVSANGQALNTFSVQVGRDLPLPPPSNLKAAVGSRQIDLTWNKSDNVVTLYRVQRAVGSGAFADLTEFPLLASTRETPHLSDNKLDPKQSYRYRVTAQDMFGRESAPGNVVTLEARLAFPISAPLITTVKNNQNQVELGWDKVTDAGIKEITVLRGDHPGKLAPLTKLPPGATSYTDKSAPPASPRYYALQVSDGSRQSEPSPERVGRAYNETPPGAPKALKAVGDDNAITLTWAASPEKDIDGYNVYRAEIGVGGKAPVVLLNGEPVTATRFKDDIPQGVQSQFRYTVKAVNTSGVEGAASEASAAQLTDKTPPPSPLLIRAQSAVGKVAIIFTLPPTPDLKEYQVYRAAQNEAEPVKVATLPPDSLGYLDSKVRGGVQYSYAVVAVDLRGNLSNASNVLSAQPPESRLTAPADLKATLSKGQISLTWADSPDALAYYVFRLEGKRRVQIAGPLLGTNYAEAARQGARYSVQAVSASGTPGPMSAEVQAK
ncbi:fibronectin type III domain-containing protein [Deinococcus alpinitundrae]|uniref:fibronectin type III domain-containing protein n=1 Tax=Deinococcus alpinitundrae TaxID=468913 RepID=UPI00137991BA|nr:hypothetical protein [Deinococcus alpinitundrae]